MIILCSVEFLSSEELDLTVTPCSFQKAYVEKFFEFGWNVFEKGENAVCWVFVTKDVEDEAFFCYESVSVNWIPVFESRYWTPW